MKPKVLSKIKNTSKKFSREILNLETTETPFIKNDILRRIGGAVGGTCVTVSIAVWRSFGMGPAEILKAATAQGGYSMVGGFLNTSVHETIRETLKQKFPKLKNPNFSSILLTTAIFGPINYAVLSLAGVVAATSISVLNALSMIGGLSTYEYLPKIMKKSILKFREKTQKIVEE